MQSKILWKLFAAFTFVITLSLSILYFYLTPTLIRFHLKTIEQTLSEKASLIRDRLDSIPPSEQNRALIDSLADHQSQEIGARVTIVSKEGKVLGDSDLNGTSLENVENHLQRPEIQEAKNKNYGVSTRYSTTVGMTMMYVAIPFKNGFIRVALPLHSVDHTIRSLKKSVFLSAVVALLLSSLVGFFLSRSMSRSLREMAHLADQIAKGNFSKRLKTNSKDEVGQLTKTINEMAMSLEKQFSELQNEKNQLQTILNDMVEGVLVSNEKNEIVLINPALQTMFSMDETCTGKTVLECIRNKTIHESIEKSLAMNSPVEGEVSFQEKHLMIQTSPFGSKSVSKGCVSVFYDVTALRKLENARREFVANVSHELKTPLTNILGYAETLRRGALQDTEAAGRFVEKIENNAIQLKSLVEDILRLSAIESGRLEMHLAPLSLEEVFREIQSTFETQIQSKNLIFEKKIPSGFIIQADPSAIKQIVGNLIDNAIKYTPNDGKITVSTIVLSSHCQISIADTGIGISEKDLPYVFERFYRVDKARSREAGGTGLGLSIVKHLVQAHGGEVGVESQIGNGTQFFFTLPV